MKLKTLMEMPRITYSTKEGLWNKLAELLEQQKLTLDNFKKTSLSNIYKCDERFASLYIHYTEKDGITAFMFFSQNAIYHKGKQYGVIQQKETLNYKNIFKNFTLEIFKEMNKEYHRPVFVDEKNSVDMMNVFVKWVNDPEKYGIKNYFVYDAKTKKTLLGSDSPEHNVWDGDESGLRYSLLFDFIGVLKESEPIGKLPDKLTYKGPPIYPSDRTFV